MFQMFLDPSMTYSCAYFENDSDSLETAQTNKIAMLLRKADIRTGHKVLEIGSGSSLYMPLWFRPVYSSVVVVPTGGCRLGDTGHRGS